MPTPVLRSVRAVAAAAVVVALTLAGCSDKQAGIAPSPPPAPAFTGPSFLKGTVGSLTQVRDFQPMLVSGYGLVVLPPGSGTGSSQVPSFLRQRMINEMRKHGLGSGRNDTEAMTPSRVLADRDTAIVEVYGLLPPGAVPGAPFDVLVRALNGDTDTTSLSGGRLWTTELAPGGTNRANLYIRPIAQAHGSTYVNPVDDRPDDQRDTDYRRQAVILAGGKATTTRPVMLVLNQPSWSLSAAIADRINGHFSRTTDRRPLAEAQNDLLIQVNVPDRFAANPARLVELIQHLYVQSGGGYEAVQAERLARQVEQNPDNTAIARHVMLCWQAMGRSIIPVLRTHYEAPAMELRLAALKAGAWLGDQRAGEHLAELTRHGDAAVRIAAVESLVHLPRNVAAFGALKDLLNDEDRRVRIAAYETLAANDDAIIGRVLVEDQQGLKYIIDRVPSTRPLVYITPIGFPRVVIFEPGLGFQTPMLASLWGDRLMVRLDRADEPLQVYYKPGPGQEARTLKAEPTVATLAYLMGHHPTMEQPEEGLDLMFSQVAEALYDLCQSGAVAAPIHVRQSPLAQLVEQAYEQPDQRPETAPGDEPGSEGQAEAAEAGDLPPVRPETGG